MSWGNEKIDRVNDFIVNYPLYRRFDFEKLYGRESLGVAERIFNLPTVFKWCLSPRCKIERPFEQVHFYREDGPQPRDDGEQGGIYYCLYKCNGCGNAFRCWIEVPFEWTEGEKWIRKVGQLPAYDITVSADLRNALREDTKLYKHALICMSQSFGVGACAYLRRTLENQIAPLFQIVYEVREEEGADEKELLTIRDVINSKTAEEKIRLANQVLPASLVVQGDNPLELIYDRLSAGLHRQDEAECMGIADEASKVLEYVIVSLNDKRQQQQARALYAERIRELRQRSVEAETT